MDTSYMTHAELCANRETIKEIERLEKKMFDSSEYGKALSSSLESYTYDSLLADLKSL